MFRPMAVLSSLLILLILAPPASAIDYSWNKDTGGEWATPGNWAPGGVPGAGDNVAFDLGGTYTVNLNGAQSANNVTLSAGGATINAFGSDFNLGGTLNLTAGTWVMGGFMGTPVTLTGGTVTRAAGATGTLEVEGDLRLVNTQIGNAAAVELSRSGGGRLRLAGTSAFAPGSVITMANTGTPYPSQSGITFEAGGVVNNLTINLGQNTTVGTVGGQSLTFGPNTVLEYADPQSNFTPAVIGREWYDGNDGIVTLTNQGTIRSLGLLVVGRYFGGNLSSNVDITNIGLMESRFALDINANNFTNATGGVVRATGGGSVFLFGRQSWVNQGTFEVSGSGSALYLGGLFTRDAIGTITRTGTGTVVGIYAGWMDNSGGTWALNATTGTIQLLGDSISNSGRIIGGAITATDGAKLEVRPYPGTYTGVDYCRLTGVAIGPGVLSFAHGGKVWMEGGSTLTAGDTITLSGNDTAFAYFQTQEVDGVAFVLSGSGSALQVFDNNVLTLGPASIVRKSGSGTAGLNGGLFSQTSGTSTAMISRGLVHVQEGMLLVGSSSTFTFTNRGTVQVDAGATWQGLLTSDGGTVTGGGTVDGNLTFTSAGNALNPGTGPGRLMVTGNLSLNAGTALHIDLNGTAAGTAHDQLAVTGSVALVDATLSAAIGGGYAPQFNDRLFILSNADGDAIIGEFAGLTDGATVDLGAYTAKISYFGDSVNGTIDLGNDIVLYNFTPVPEPHMVLAVAAAGSFGVGLLRRVRDRRAPRGPAQALPFATWSGTPASLAGRRRG
jgi:hypothetical protein